MVGICYPDLPLSGVNMLFVDDFLHDDVFKRRRE